ncbi:MAG: RNA-binding protein [Deltaproteobacteria bacterium]|nr:RNA-binding protein [Deltaproteobacteria bacterium]
MKLRWVTFLGRKHQRNIRDDTDNEAIRLDKWLWAARFFKTRALAAEAIGGGKIDIDGARAKPSRVVRIGDKLNIRRGPIEWAIVVKAVSRLRGPAPQAQGLYEETTESVAKRQAVAAQMKFERGVEFDSPGRPSKRDRRDIAKFTKRGW